MGVPKTSKNFQKLFRFELCGNINEESKNELEKMKERVKKVDGYLGEEPCRSLFEEDKFVTISYWCDKEALKTWRDDSEHRQTRQIGKDKFFKWYEIQILESQREHG